MTRKQTALRRAISAVVLVLGTTVAALLPLADAYAERNTTAAYSHVEQAGAENCAPIHDEHACQLCRVVRLPASDSCRHPELGYQRPSHRPDDPEVTGFTVRRLSDARSPRAPPAA